MHTWPPTPLSTTTIPCTADQCAAVGTWAEAQWPAVVQEVYQFGPIHVVMLVHEERVIAAMITGGGTGREYRMNPAVAAEAGL